MDDQRQELAFITGANDKYFFLCGMLVQSLEEWFPGIPCFVMDFGFSEPQRKVFENRNQLLKLPPHLKKADHPFRLKSSLRSFLGDQFKAMPIFLDADAIAVSAGSEELFEITRRLNEEQKIIAIAPDGVFETIKQVAEAFQLPKFKSVIASNPHIMECQYLNSGVVFFPVSRVLEDYEASASLLEGDILWEQHALNLICHRNPSSVLVLDSRIWNVHAKFLNKITVEDGRPLCDGKKCVFAHAVNDQSVHNVDAVQMQILKNGYVCNTYLRLFVNSFLRAAQDKYLSNFLSSNFAALVDFKVLIDQRTRQNELCPCNSGKRFKDCHGAFL